MQRNSGTRPASPRQSGAFTGCSPSGFGKWPWAAAAVPLILAIGLVLTETTGLTRLTARLFPPAAPGPVRRRDGVPVAEKAPTPLVLPFDAEPARIGQEAWARRLGAAVETTNTIGMKFRLIPPGEFFMTPQYRVRISKPFRLSAYETTVGQFRAFVGETKYQTSAETSGEGGSIRTATAKTSESRNTPGGIRTRRRATITPSASSAGTTPSSSATG